MKYRDFKVLVKQYPYFRSMIFHHLTDKTNTLRRQVNEWVKKGYILELKRGMYTLADDERAIAVSPYYLANHIYSPSYISLESALSFYNLIPEKVHAITSITSKKTFTITNKKGHFIYHNIKQNSYNGFESLHDENNQMFFIASPEKALADFLYLRCRTIKKYKKDVFDKSFRFQNLDMLNDKKLLKLSNKFQSKKLMRLVELLIQYKRENNA